MSGENLLTYKGYTGKVSYSLADRVFYGTVLGISDLVDFQSNRADELEDEFHKAVDDYIAFCEKNSKEPQAYRGTLNIRISPELHREIAVRADYEGISVNHFVERSLADAVNDYLW